MVVHSSQRSSMTCSTFRIGASLLDEKWRKTEAALSFGTVGRDGARKSRLCDFQAVASCHSLILILFVSCPGPLTPAVATSIFPREYVGPFGKSRTNHGHGIVMIPLLVLLKLLTTTQRVYRSWSMCQRRLGIRYDWCCSAATRRSWKADDYCQSCMR